jgi:hypothetical protein
MQLTKSLLKIDFKLNIELPNDRLCPPVRALVSFLFFYFFFLFFFYLRPFMRPRPLPRDYKGQPVANKNRAETKGPQQTQLYTMDEGTIG